jgi:hypothetical protein
VRGGLIERGDGAGGRRRGRYCKRSLRSSASVMSLLVCQVLAAGPLAAQTPPEPGPGPQRIRQIEVGTPKPRPVQQQRRAPAPRQRTVAAPPRPAATTSGPTGPPGSAPAPVPARQDAASEQQVTGEQINAIPVSRPGEALEITPGLVVTQHSGEGKANQYFLRGFNLDHGTDLAIFVDGMPVNLRTHGHGQGYADINFLIPELIKSMDIRKGRTSPTRATSPRRAHCTSTTATATIRAWRKSRSAVSAIAACSPRNHCRPGRAIS